MNETRNGKPLRSYSVALVAASFGLNCLWEMAQMSAYVELAARAWTDTLSVCTWATIGDVGITVVIYGIGSLAAGQVRWGMRGGWNVYSTGALLGGAVATVIVLRTLTSGRWSYTDVMPLVPVFIVGLLPFLQLLLLVPAALGIVEWWVKRR